MHAVVRTPVSVTLTNLRREWKLYTELSWLSWLSCVPRLPWFHLWRSPVRSHLIQLQLFVKL